MSKNLQQRSVRSKWAAKPTRIAFLQRGFPITEEDCEFLIEKTHQWGMYRFEAIRAIETIKLLCREGLVPLSSRQRFIDRLEELQGTNHPEIAGVATEALSIIHAHVPIERNWDMSPEEIMELHGRRNLTRMDLDFLIEKTKSASVQMVDAIRTLAIACEDGLTNTPEIVEVFVRLLAHEVSFVRQKAAEALWQVSAFSALGDLERALVLETHPDVKTSLEHVIVVFKRLMALSPPSP